MSVTLSSLPEKFKCSCSDGITPNFGLTGPNNTYIGNKETKDFIHDKN